MFDTSHLHPMLVHFPIALAMVGFLLEITRFFFPKWISISTCGEVLLYIASLSAIAAVLSGVLFTGEFTGETLDVKNMHALLGFLATATLALTSFVYLYQRIKATTSKGLKMLGLALYLIATTLIGATGFMGGSLVYSYLIGI